MLATGPVRDTWLTKLKFDLDSGALTETQAVVDYRNFLRALDTSVDYEDIDWPEYPSA